MTKFFLHGGGEGKGGREHNRFFGEIVDNLSDGAKVLLVYFAIPKEEIAVKHPVYEKYFLENASGKKMELKIATEENFIKDLRWADGVYFRGGDTDMLLERIKKYPNFRETLLKKKLVAGSSAGVYFLANVALSARRDIVYKGLGILPIKVNCHYTDENKDEIKKLDKYPGKFLLLREGEFVVMDF